MPPTGPPEKLVSTGLPHLPDSDARESVVEKRCAGCGCWNHAAEMRCQRCGRKLEAFLGAESRRELEETESLPGPSMAAAAPRTASEPAWKDELSKRLAGYRERRAAFEETAEITRPAATPRPSLPTRIRSARPSMAGAAGRDEYSALPPVRGQAERQRPAAEPPRRLAEPPIVDRLLTGPAHLRVRQPRPRVEDLLAPIKYRFIAGLLDICVVAAALGVFLGIMHLMNPAILVGPNRLPVVGGAFLALQVIYWIAYLRLMGSTAGMHWTGLRVFNLDAQSPDVQQRWTRLFATVLSAAALGVGFLWSLFDEQRLTWHDRVSKTFVGVNG